MLAGNETRRAAAYILIAGGCMAAFSVSLPPYADPSTGIGFIDALQGDLPLYAKRFALSLVLLGLIPIASAPFIVKGARIGDWFKPRAGFMRSPLFLTSLPLGLLAGFIGASSPDLAAYYPYSQTLAGLAASNPAYAALHASLYVACYYLPWELFFRGYLLLLPLPIMEKGLPLWIAVFAQAIPSAFLHIGHPASEMIAALPAGIVFGYFAYASRSIIPPLVLHALIGVSTDLFIIYGVGR
jgi:membrane protease YdiL (CAAX protease family)